MRIGHRRSARWGSSRCAVAVALGVAACGAGEWRGGIHARMAFHPEKGLRVVEVPEGPAREAGLGEGDRIVAIDGAPVEGHTLDEVRERLEGPVGTEVELTVERSEETDQTHTQVLRVRRAPYRAAP